MINQDVNGSRKLFWKKVDKTKGRKVKIFHRIDKTGRLAVVLEIFLGSMIYGYISTLSQNVKF